MGILLALVWPHVERMRRTLPLLELLGVAALATTIFLFRQMTDFDPTLWHGGDLAAAFCFAVLVAAVAHPASRLNGALGIAPLRWVGERSYGIYLWHFPIVELTRPGVDVSWTGPGLIVAQATLTVVAAALSYRFVEQPIRTGRLQRRLAQVQLRRRLELVGAGAAALVGALVVLFLIPSPISLYTNPPVADAAQSAYSGWAPRISLRLPVPAELHAKPKPPPKTVAPRLGRILAIGDSVMLGCSSQLATALDHRVRIDATVGRQIDDTIKDLDRYRAHHKLPKTIVLQIGNNGPLWYADLTRLKHALRGVTDVVVVNVRNSTSWEHESDHAITNWVKGWKAARIADWYGNSKNSMLSDGTHPWPYACTIYARVIAAAVRSSPSPA